MMDSTKDLKGKQNYTEFRLISMMSLHKTDFFADFGIEESVLRMGWFGHSTWIV
jgi:hypothetical protein